MDYFVLVSFGQVKQSKVLTISYLVEKLDQNCIGDFNIKRRTLKDLDDDVVRITVEKFSARKFDIVQKGNFDYLVVDIKLYKKVHLSKAEIIGQKTRINY